MRYSWRVLILLGAVGALSTGCDGALVSLGDREPPHYHFGMPRLLAELDTTYSNENPTLTGDLLELWFNSNRGSTNGDVFRARRDSTQMPFTAVERVAEVSSDMHETSPGISLDGLSIYFGSDRAGGVGDLDIWRATRATRTSAWSPAENLSALNTTTRDVPRPLGQHDLVMPLSSQRDNSLLYQTFLSARPSVGGTFGTPESIPELAFADRTTVDAFLSDDGLTLLYASGPLGGKLDLWVAWRKTTEQPFSLAIALDDPNINSAADERDPWLSPDGSLFYFVSDRNNGVLQIFEAAVSRGSRGGQ